MDERGIHTVNLLQHRSQLSLHPYRPLQDHLDWFEQRMGRVRPVAVRASRVMTNYEIGLHSPLELSVDRRRRRVKRSPQLMRGPASPRVLEEEPEHLKLHLRSKEGENPRRRDSHKRILYAAFANYAWDFR